MNLARSTDGAVPLGPYGPPLEDRYRTFLRSLPSGTAWPVESVSRRSDWSRAPVWLRLPLWLHASSAWRVGLHPDPDLLEILWGQHTLFLFIRIQDDLLDGHFSDLGLQFLADRLFLESLESFARLTFLGDEFHALYRRAVASTADGILDVRKLEAEPGRMTSDCLHLHAKVASIFKVGGEAACRRLGRTDDLQWMSSFQDRLAVFDQICDDLEDVNDDVQAGRFTWVANRLLRLVPGSHPPGALRDGLRSGVLVPDRVEPVFSELGRVADEAGEVLPPSAPPPLRELVRRMRKRPDELRHRLRRAWVRRLFPGVLEPESPG